MWTMQPNSSNPRGNLTITVRTLQNGSTSDLLYDPIPDYMFEVPAEVGQAVVTVNDVTAQCSTARDFVGQWWDPYYDSSSYDGATYSGEYTRTHDCSFEYTESSTPVVTNSSTGADGNIGTVGDLVTITGSGFISPNATNSTAQVRFGGAACTLVTRTRTQITCTLGHMKSGQYHPVVIVSHIGQARIASGALQVNVPLAVTSLTPIHHGVRGTTLLQISGSGFSHIGPENQVEVGNRSCSIVSANFTLLMCYTPLAPINSLDSTCWGGTDCSNATVLSGAMHDVSWGFNVSNASITITAGDTVRWNFDQTPAGVHNLMSGLRSAPTAEFSCPYASSGSCSHQFSVPGNYPIHCTPHTGMNAVVTVLASRRTRRDIVSVPATVNVRVFDYQPSNTSVDGAWGNWVDGIFDGYDAGTEEYVVESSRLDGAWAGWESEVSNVLRETKYYGYVRKFLRMTKVILTHENRLQVHL